TDIQDVFASQTTTRTEIPKKDNLFDMMLLKNEVASVATGELALASITKIVVFIIVIQVDIWIINNARSSIIKQVISNKQFAMFTRLYDSLSKFLLVKTYYVSFLETLIDKVCIDIYTRHFGVLIIHMKLLMSDTTIHEGKDLVQHLVLIASRLMHVATLKSNLNIILFEKQLKKDENA
ncbi:hypothetical protein ACJX0J_018300, partial [Zea mays]